MEEMKLQANKPELERDRAKNFQADHKGETKDPAQKKRKRQSL